MLPTAAAVTSHRTTHLLVGGVKLVRLLRAQEETGAHVVVVEAALPPQDDAHRYSGELRRKLLDIGRGLLMAELRRGSRRFDGIAGGCGGGDEGLRRGSINRSMHRDSVDYGLVASETS